MFLNVLIQVLCDEECEASLDKYELVTLPSGLQVWVTSHRLYTRFFGAS